MRIHGVRCLACSSCYKFTPSNNIETDKTFFSLILKNLAVMRGCPNCQSRSLELVVEELEDITHYVTTEQFWRLLSGRDSDVRSIDEVNQALVGHKIEKIEVFQQPTGRCALRGIHLDSGSKIQLAVGYGDPVVAGIKQGKL